MAPPQLIQARRVMASSSRVARMPPCTMPFQPWNFRLGVKTARQVLPSTVQARSKPSLLSAPQAKQKWSSISSTEAIEMKFPADQIAEFFRQQARHGPRGPGSRTARDDLGHRHHFHGRAREKRFVGRQEFFEGNASFKNLDPATPGQFDDRTA